MVFIKRKPKWENILNVKQPPFLFLLQREKERDCVYVCVCVCVCERERERERGAKHEIIFS